MARIYTTIFTLILSLFSLVTVVVAQEGTLILDPVADYTFGEELRFSLLVQNASEVEHLTLNFRPELSTNIYEVDVPFQPGEMISVTQSIAISSIDIRPFSDVTYSWEVQTASGPQKSPDQHITYEDDGYAWQKMTRDNATAHWVGEPPPFGQSVLDLVDGSLSDLDAIVPLEKIDPIDIYVYPTMVELRSALPDASIEDFPLNQFDLGVILLATANSQMAATELPQSVPYELAHLLLYRAAGKQYASLPWWLREGIAGGVQPNNNPYHDQLLAEAIQNGSTISLQDLCDQPQGTGARQDLAALQSASVVRFIAARQSTGTIPDLLTAYINGDSCERGVEQVLGVSLHALEQEWLASMQEPTSFERFFNDVAIWIIILIAGTLLIVFLISTTRQKE